MNSSSPSSPDRDPTMQQDNASAPPEKPTRSESELVTGGVEADAIPEAVPVIAVGGMLAGYKLLQKLGEGGRAAPQGRAEGDEARDRRQGIVQAALLP
jgi:hypothetical protein